MLKFSLGLFVLTILGSVTAAPSKTLGDLWERKSSLPNCDGSSLCSTFFNSKLASYCAGAESKINPNHTYTAGGTGSGPCSGTCGIFVQGNKDSQGNKCSATGQDLQNAVTQLAEHNCEVCGNVAAPVGGDCTITKNFVNFCYN